MANPNWKKGVSGNPSGKKKIKEPEYTLPTIPIPRELTARQSHYIEARMDGATKEQARDIAGYNKRSPPQTIEKSPAVKNALVNAMLTVGIGEAYLAKKLKDGLTSKDYRYFAKDGVVTDKRVVPDMAVREKYLRTCLEATGYIKQGSDVNMNLGVIVLPKTQTVDEWNDEPVVASK